MHVITGLYCFYPARLMPGFVVERHIYVWDSLLVFPYILYVCVYVGAHTHTCIHTYIHVYIHVCVYLCVCTWLEMCVLIEGHTNYVGVSYIYRSYTCLYSVWIVCVPLLCSPIVFIPHFRDPKSTIISTHPRSRIESDCQSSSSSYPAWYRALSLNIIM